MRRLDILLYRHPDSKVFSKPADVHYSGKGCAALAKQVAEAIREHGLRKGG